MKTEIISFNTDLQKQQFSSHTQTDSLTMPGEAGGCDETFAQGLLSLVRYGPVISKYSALQLV